MSWLIIAGVIGLCLVVAAVAYSLGWLAGFDDGKGFLYSKEGQKN